MTMLEFSTLASPTKDLYLLFCQVPKNCINIIFLVLVMKCVLKKCDIITDNYSRLSVRKNKEFTSIFHVPFTISFIQPVVQLSVNYYYLFYFLIVFTILRFSFHVNIIVIIGWVIKIMTLRFFFFFCSFSVKNTIKALYF